MADLFVTVSLVEVVWTVVILATLCFNCWAAYDAWIDVVLLRKRKLDGTRRIQARGNLRTEFGRIYRSSIFFIIGVIALVTPEVSRETSIASTIATIVFISVVFVDLIQSILDRLDRKEVLDIEEAKAIRVLQQSVRIEELSAALQNAQEETMQAQAETITAHEETVQAQADTAVAQEQVKLAEQGGS